MSLDEDCQTPVIPEIAEEAPSGELAEVQPATEEADTAPRNVVYGTFWINETEFALPVDVFQEVVDEPDEYSRVPMSPSHMVGLFCLRNTIIPVIDLRCILGFPEPSQTQKRKVAILENGDLCIGLLFDDTGGIIHSVNATRVEFQPNSDGIKDVIIEGVLKLDNGAKMVQLLDPFEILNIEKLPRTSKKGATAEKNSYLGQRLNCISFQLGHTTCAIDLRYVHEITDMQELQHSQLAYGHLLGNIELRGRTIPIVDFRGLIGNEPPFSFDPEALKSRKLLVLDLPEGRIGLLVYSIDSIMTFYEKDILPFANVALPRHDIVAGCLVKEDEKIVILLDHAALMRDDTLVRAAQSCREIYPSEEKVKERSKLQGHLVRSTYILFSVDMELGLDISCVSELIDRPKTLLRPPYALKFVEGILNLRGELITLINLRVLYDFPNTKVEAKKVLIFEANKKKYGIAVDSIDEIVTMNTNELLDAPSIQNSEIARRVSEDLVGCLPIPSRPATSDPVFILDEKLLVTRCVDDEALAKSIEDAAPSEQKMAM